VADKLIGSVYTGSHYVRQTFTGIPDNAFISASVFVKKAEAPRCALLVLNKNNVSAAMEFNFDDERLTGTYAGSGNGSLLLNNGVTQYKVQKYDNGWYRLMFQNWSVLTGAVNPDIRIYTSHHYGPGDTTITKSGSTTVRNVIQSPIAGWNADSVIEDTNNVTHFVSMSGQAVVNRKYRARVYVKALGSGATRYASMMLVSGSAFTVSSYVVMNLSTGAITLRGPTVNNRISQVGVTDVGGGWWLIEIEYSPNNYSVVPE
jgi:hypothetical protein